MNKATKMSPFTYLLRFILQQGDSLRITQEEIALVESRYFPDDNLQGLFRQYKYVCFCWGKGMASFTSF